MKILKWLIYTVLTSIVLAVLSLELFYQYKVHQLKPQEIHSEHQHSTSAKEVLWVELTESGDIELEKLTATEYLLRVAQLFAVAAYEPIQQVGKSRIPVKGMHLASVVSRQISFRKTTSESQGQIHINNAVRTVWLTRNTTVDELLGYLLKNMFVGEGVYGLDQAAEHFFDKAESDLTRDEIVSVISLLKAPSRYHPIRDPKRFKLRTEYMAERLRNNWPEKYGDYMFVPPVFLLN